MTDDVCFSRLAGVSFYQEALASCSAGDRVRFVHEPDNPYDEMAIRVVTVGGSTIGYLPKGSGLRAAVHERGRGLSGTIDSVGYSRACLLGASISIAICDDELGTESYYPGKLLPDPPKGGYRYWVNSPAAVAPRAAARK